MCTFPLILSDDRGNQYESADEWRSLSPSEAATGAGDIYALLAYEEQMQAGNLLSLSRGNPFQVRSNV
jgi:hypothetical protein